MKKILNFISAFYFSYSFIYNFNNKILIHFIYYLIFDISYFIFCDSNNILKNDIIIHHINGLICVYSNLLLYKNNISEKVIILDKTFALQEITTLIISLKLIINNLSIKKYLNYILSIIWIPLRIILPYYCIYNYYESTYLDNIYFKIKIITTSIFLLLNIKWALLSLKIIDNSNHYSSLLLLLPILSIKKNIIIFNLILLTSLFSFIYNMKKNRLTISLDTSFMSILCLKLGYNLNLNYLFLILIILFTTKYYFTKSEIYSLLLIFTFIHKFSINPRIYYYCLFSVLFSYLYRHFKKVPFLWHLSVSISIILGINNNLYIINY